MYSHANAPAFFLRTLSSYDCQFLLIPIVISRNFSGPTSQGMVYGLVCSSIMKTQGVSLETHLQKSNRVEQRIEGNMCRLSKRQIGLIHSQ